MWIYQIKNVLHERILALEQERVDIEWWYYRQNESLTDLAKTKALLVFYRQNESCVD